jgi:polyferredoxin
MLKYLVLAAIVALPLLLPDRPIFGNWPALFCAVDPFRTIFTFFLSGSILVATILIVLALFFNRFFCRYLCFYGALLTICTRTGLLRRMTGRRIAPKLEEEVVKEEQEAKGEVEVPD